MDNLTLDVREILDCTAFGISTKLISVLGTLAFAVGVVFSKVFDASQLPNFFFISFLIDL